MRNLSLKINCSSYDFLVAFWFQVEIRYSFLDENSSTSIYAENSAVHMSKMLTFYRDAPFEITAKYTNPARVTDQEELISKFLVRLVL